MTNRLGHKLGNVMADFIAEQLGSWRFVAWQTLGIWIWIGWNLWAPPGTHFDPEPFIALNLLLSLQAAYTGPVLLISANRSGTDDRRRLHRMERDIAKIKEAVGASD